MAEKKYDWKFCSLGGVTRVNIATGEDIAHLGELDKKLWTVLSCPTTGLEADPKTLQLLDTDKNGKIRVDEIVAAAEWLTTVLRNPDDLLKGEDNLPLSAFNTENEDGAKLFRSAKQILCNLYPEKYCDDAAAAAAGISLQDTQDRLAIFSKTKFNGDGIIASIASDDEAVRQDIAFIIDTLGGLTDRSGEPGADADKIEAFYAACADFAAWKQQCEENTAEILPYGDNTAAAYASMQTMQAKVEDYFMRCNFVAFDESVQSALDVSADKVAAISGDILSEHSEEIATYPLARPRKEAVLPIRQGINPAWREAFANFKSLILDVRHADQDSITEAEWQNIVASFGAYAAWMAAKKGEAVEKLGYDCVKEILSRNNKATLLSLVEQDKALSTEVESMEEVDKLLYLYRDFYKILRNYVIFTDFYDRTDTLNTTFQAGRLFVDQRSFDLCVRVDDMSKHATIAAASSMFLLYCTCTNKVKNLTMNIAAVVTKGEVSSLYVGQNAVFYDRQGGDWDAVVTKIVDNPISIKNAFWSPYRKLGKLISDQIDKMAAEKDAKANAELTEKVDLNKLAAPSAPAADGSTPAAKPPFDIAKFAGIFAALGLAVGAIGAALGSIFSTFVKMQWWQMILVVVLVMLVISGPAMFIAWRKLRVRNLGPLLNANGWAINSKVIVNSAFGNTLTNIAHYPIIKTNDPYAQQKPLWRRVLTFVVEAALILGIIGYFLVYKPISEKRKAEAAKCDTVMVEKIVVVEPDAATPAATDVVVEK